MPGIPGNGTPDIDPILDAAAELFERHGYDDTTIDLVAERSGYARSTVFRRYPTKTALLRAIVETFLASFPPFVETFLAGQTTPRPTPSHPAAPRPASPADSRTPAGSPSPVVGPPAGVLIHALQSYLARHGALARVALAAKDLPWCRPTDCNAEPAWRTLAERCLGGPTDPLACRLLLDAIKYCAHGHAGCSPAAALALGRTVADLGVLVPHHPRPTRKPGRPS